jgi:large-conductance mechanosensitive channel
MLEEFKKFGMRGNVVDLAVAVIIGAALPRRRRQPCPRKCSC